MSQDDCYIKIEKNRIRTLYGPMSRDQAEKAGYFARSVNDRDEAAKRTGKSFKIWANLQYEEYSPEEITDLISYPSEYGLKACKVVNKPVPIHESWNEITPDGREWLFNNDSGRTN
jgi:hypothetical protein